MICAITAMLFCLSCGTSATTETDTPPAVERLCVKDGRLYDRAGNPVVLKGVSFGWHNMWPRFYNAGAVRTLAEDWNADVVRASIGVGLRYGYEDFPDEAVAAATAVADAAIENGIYVIIDWHSHFLKPDEAKEFFTIMARRYKGVPNVIYELFNEPIEDSWSELKAYYIELAGLIRSIDDSEPLILVGCPHWDQDIHLAADEPLEGFDNIMYTLHFYAGTHKQELRERADYALSKGLPIFVSECGGMNADGNGPLDTESFAEWTSWTDKNGISMVMWSLSDKFETCSMLVPFASSEGAWDDSYIKEWGQLVRSTLNRNTR